MAFVGGMVLWTSWKAQSPVEEKPVQKLPDSLGAVVAYQPLQMTLPPPPPPAPAPAPLLLPKPEPPPPRTVEAAYNPLPQPRREPVAQMAPAMAVTPPAPTKPYVLSYADPPTPPGAQAVAGGMGAAGSQAAVSGVSYAASRLGGVQAGLLGDQTFLLMPGILPCILDTAIDSTLEGPIQCHIRDDIRPNGVTLLDRGSVIQGWYKNNVQTGQSRLFVQADWVRTPGGCFIQFQNAPMSDPLGRSGLDGNVDNHLSERFGATMMLTLADSAINFATALASKGGNTYLSFGNGGGGAGGIQSVADSILRSQINIPPTITKAQGSPIAVFVTKPLDFSPCYDLKIKDR